MTTNEKLQSDRLIGRLQAVIKLASRPNRTFTILILLLASAIYGPTALAQSDEILRHRIQSQAGEMDELQRTNVRVYVEGRAVVLSGEVRLYAQRMTYEKIAWQTIGVVEIENEIQVVPKHGLDDAEIEREIAMILETDRRLQGARIAVSVDHGAVSLEGFFVHPQNVLFLKHKVAEIEGVIDLEIRAKFTV